MKEALTNSQRVKISEQKKKDKGFRKLWMWIYPEDKEKIRNFIKKTTTDRVNDAGNE